MINEGIKNKPLDRYPYMENDLKNGTLTSENLKKLLPEQIVYNDFIITDAEFSPDYPFHYIAVKSGGYIYLHIDGQLTEKIESHSFKQVAHINVTKYPELKPSIRGLVSSLYYAGNVVSGSGAINIFNYDDIDRSIIVADAIYPIIPVVEIN